jgi:hypothetical protein
MNFPQYWARGASGDVSAWCWSFRSLSEAQALAQQAAEQIADRFRCRGSPPNTAAMHPEVQI